MAKNIDKLTVTISVENAEEALVKAMDISKHKLIEWRELMLAHGYQHRAHEIQGWINVIVKAQEED